MDGLILKRLKLHFSTDHAQKKIASIEVPFSLYLKMITQPDFIESLPKDLQNQMTFHKSAFDQRFGFLSFEDRALYLKTPYIRFLLGETLYRFCARVLSLHYQSLRFLLETPPGSLEEFFQEGAPFWKKTLVRGDLQETERTSIQQGLFFIACLHRHIYRTQEKENRMRNLDAFAKDEIRVRDEKIHTLEIEITQLKTALAKAQKNADRPVHVVLGDPYHMLGLKSGNLKEVEPRATTLIKILHPDRSLSEDTAYLFDLIVKARDEILKTSSRG